MVEMQGRHPRGIGPLGIVTKIGTFGEPDAALFRRHQAVGASWPGKSQLRRDAKSLTAYPCRNGDTRARTVAYA